MHTESEPTTIDDMLKELDDLDEESDVGSSETASDKEIALYASLPRLRDNGNINPLQWWNSHKATFPHLAMLAKKYLCVQATSVPSERVFSAAGNIVTAKRNRLKPARVNKLCFLAANL